MSDVTFVIVPGWRNSGPGHWQSLWANQLPNAVRVEQDDWVSPLRSAWVARLGETIHATDGPVILVAHSLGCIAATHLPDLFNHRIRGALLAAPADAERRPALADFAPVARRRLPYPSTVVASSNDPYCPMNVSAAFAQAWGSELVQLEGAGHINVDSGHGPWPAGLALLARLVDQTRPPPAQRSARPPVATGSIYPYRITTKKQIRLNQKTAL
jgi:hypothetical protein